MWETIPEHVEARGGLATYASHRLKVPGGWLVRTVSSNCSSGGGTSVVQTLIPDANHEWKHTPKP